MKLIDWNKVFDRLKQELETESDADIARWLSVRPEQISKARTGAEAQDGSEDELPAYAKFVALDHCKYFEARDVVFSLLPKKAREKVLAIERARTKKIASKPVRPTKGNL